MKTVTIKVTKKDIEKGWNGDGLSCPIHEAVKRRLRVKYTEDVRVGPSDIDIYRKTYPLPDEAQVFSTMQADFGFEKRDKSMLKILKPFSFKLNLED